MQGLVIRTTGSWYKVLPINDSVSTGNGNVHFAPLNEGLPTLVECRLRGSYRLRGNKQTNPIAVGDRVVFAMQDDGTGAINEVCDRRNYIVRKATKLSKQTHVIAANIDQLCIIATTAFPRTSTGFIDRMLVTAEAYHIPACIVFNKIDLQDELLDKSEPETEGSHHHTLAAMHALYEPAGYPIYEVSALRGDGLEQIRDLVKGKVTLFSGHSGVGKSALLNAVDPTLTLRVGAVSEWSMKGKHTTTFAEIFPVCFPKPSGKNKADTSNSTTNTTIPIGNEEAVWNHADGLLIDTPGIKEFGMVDVKPEELSHFFPEMRSRLHDCHFANCTHRHEPHCAIKAAVAAGEIPEERYENYLNIIESIISDQ